MAASVGRAAGRAVRIAGPAPQSGLEEKNNAMNESKLFSVPTAETPHADSIESARAAKLKKLAEMRAFVDTLADAVGNPLDEGIKETVAVLNAADIPTEQSCEGHDDPEQGRPYPWVRVALDGEPAERFIGEQAAFEAAARENGVTVEDLRRGSPEAVYVKVITEVSENDETPEYLAWTEKNLTVQTRVQSLLDEFYAERAVPDDIRLVIDSGVGGFEIRSNQENNNQVIFREISPEEFAMVVAKLKDRQQEMIAFSDFVREKFING